ncbi:hypothetical protein [Ideonella azotifigens]|uniref:hypothetical protein n=1 Tax=Ideonella azotifigens TaxID=513160 RepID=UPI001141DA3F|nr:hypothetical protein [Ideonella azotifigens]
MSASTNGAISFGQTAQAGNGGDSDTGRAGNGGDAGLSQTYQTSQASELHTDAYAFGGHGGHTDAGVAGTGGAASLVQTLSNTRVGGTLNARATAQGGNSAGGASGGAASVNLTGTTATYTALLGQAFAGDGTWQGNASATVTANTTAAGGSATASASAVGYVANATALTTGLGAASLRSDAYATGNSGGAVATSTVTSGDTRITASAGATAEGGVHSQAVSTFNSRAGFLGSSEGLQAFAYSNGNPGKGALNAALSGRPNVTAALRGGSVLGLGSLGASYGNYAKGNCTYSASATYSFSLASSSNLTLGLLGMTAHNDGFTSMSFSVVSGATTLVSTSFTTLASAQTYFTDHPLSLGSFTAGANNLVLSFSLTASAAKGADIGYVLSAKATGALAPVATTSITAGTDSARRAPLLVARTDRGLGFKTSLVTLRPSLDGAAFVSRLSPRAEVAAAVDGENGSARKRQVLPVFSVGAALHGADRR